MLGAYAPGDSMATLYVTQPISRLLLAASVLSIVGALWQHRRIQRKAAGAAGDTDF